MQLTTFRITLKPHETPQALPADVPPRDRHTPGCRDVQPDKLHGKMFAPEKKRARRRRYIPPLAADIDNPASDIAKEHRTKFTAAAQDPEVLARSGGNG